MKPAWRRWQWAVSAAVVLLAGVLLWRQLGDLSMADLRRAFAATPWPPIVAAVTAAAISFSCLATYEWFALQWAAPGRLSRAQALRTGAMAHAISNTLGFHALTGGAFRYQQYARQGLGVADIARVVALVALCVGTGVVLVAAGAFAWLQWQSAESPVAVLLAPMILGLGAALCWRLFGRRGGAVNPARQFVLLAPVAALEMLAAVAALYVLLPPAIMPAPAHFILVVVGATLFGIASHAPGGIGVFEAGVLAAMPQAPVAEVLAALLLFRVIYNLLPFSLTLLGLFARRISSTADISASAAAGGNAGGPAPAGRPAHDRADGWHR